MRHHQDGVAGVVQLAKNLQHDGFVNFVEIACGLIGENQLGLVDESARDGYALLLATGKLRGQVCEAVAQADALQRFAGLLLVCFAVKVLRQHHILERREVRHEMKLLEHKTHFFGAIPDDFAFAELRKIDAIDDDAPGSQRIQAAENIDEGSFPRAGRSHERDPLAGGDAETQAIDRAQGAVFLRERSDCYLGGAHASPRKTDAGRILASRLSG